MDCDELALDLDHQRSHYDQERFVVGVTIFNGSSMATHSTNIFLKSMCPGEGHPDCYVTLVRQLRQGKVTKLR